MIDTEVTDWETALPNSHSLAVTGPVPSHLPGTGVMLVGHGTRDQEGTRQFFELSNQLQHRLGETPVAPCLLEFQQPTIAEAWQSLIADGVSRVCVAPLLLFAAGHAKQDIPDAVAACHEQSPAVFRCQAGPLSRHPAIVELVRRRLAESLNATGAEPTTTSLDRTAVVMVGRGSHDPCAQADMRVLGEVAASLFGAALVTTAFYAMAEPKLPSVLDQVASSGRFDRVIVQPHLLFTGRLYQAISRQVNEAGQRHSTTHFRLSNYLGPDPLVAEAIAGRITTASASLPKLDEAG